jgi:site-specific recombinase XerD
VGPDHTANPLIGFPSIKAVPRKLPVTLSPEQVSRLLAEPETDTVIGLRDRALLALLYGTGIRASECASFRSGQVDLAQLTITVQGKGGHDRVIPLNPQLAEVLRTYAQARGPALRPRHFFDHASGAYCHAAASTNAYARGASAVASVFHSQHIGCDILLQPTWCAPGLAW